MTAEARKKKAKRKATNLNAALTPRQTRFVELYLVSLNATDAYREAYGATQKVAEANGSRMLGNAKVAAKIAEARAVTAKKAGIDADALLTELTLIVLSDVRDFHVDATGELTLREGANDNAWRAVSSIKHRIKTIAVGTGSETTREVELKLWPKVEAIKVTREHLGLTKEGPAVDPGEVARAIRDAVRASDEAEGLAA